MTVFELCNQAISVIRGKRLVLSSTERTLLESLDYEGLANAHAQDEAVVCAMNFARVRDRLQQAYPWVFCRNGTIINGTTDTVFPSGLLTVLGVFYKNEPVEFEEADDVILCNASGDMSMRYTKAITEISQMDAVFKEALCYELAQEIISATTGSNEGVAVLEQKKQALIVDAYKMEVIKAETRIPAKLELFNRAIGLVKGLKTEQPDILDTRYEDELSACRRCYVSVRDRLLQSYSWVFARKTETPALLSESVPGWKYTYMLPDDCLRVIAVIGKDRRADWGMERDCRNISDFSDMVELTEYETARKELYANRDVVYVRYTSRVEDSTKWAAMFTEALVLMMAIEVALNVVGDKNIVAVLEQRLSRLIEEAQMNAVIRDETRLPKQKESHRTGAVNRVYLDYSGIPTLPCETGYVYIMKFFHVNGAMNV